MFDKFSLTLDSGNRTEAAGPFFYDQQKELEKVWAVPPLFSVYADPAVESKEFDLLYPLLTCERYGTEYRWQFFQLLSIAGGDDQRGFSKKRFTVFPFYFQQRSPETNENYTALLPFYGHLKNRLFRDDIFFVMLPLYVQTTKKETVTDNYFYPFFHLRHGNGVNGWQFWPVVGDEHKVLTKQTNGFGDITVIGGYHKFFALWPFYFWQDNNLGTTNVETLRATLPLYSIARSPMRDSTSVIWPFFSWIEDREKKYVEWEGPWPFVVVARGEGKTTTRVWPLFGQSHNDSLERNFYLWPVYRFKGIHTPLLEARQTRILFYLYIHTTEKNLETHAEKKRVDAWPFFTYHRDFNGNNRLQILALIEPVLPNHRGIERNWSPLWSLWRSENNPKTGAASQSLLWNLYRHDKTPTSKKCSLLFGLFQYQSNAETKRLRLLYIPVFKSHATAGSDAK
ncbi:MAG: hypothetical protein WDM76_07520 [Limisphaerales bacterium]